ncbi:hypothetical protein [Paracraurococcus ruber]|uniref:Uncharacterized protein n=1 Tax=Paracraurococcus ruber TaxID=77675 RepID=A0ABS1D1T4_9PROT|nr:hypothetical protein [Paracraurococcus ruber]MBK1660762.1 hypothetical protein [Paracraurococcus ruber]TDG16796.1 hypothetical protein E2C05_28915 [Paracraurococcus ruber]
MSLSLILHDLSAVGAEAESRFFEAIFQVAPEHWRVRPEATLAATTVSPAYLRDHLLASLPADRRPGTLLLVTRMPPDASWNALSGQGDAWVQDMLNEG